jgi:NADH-quinone oxidoreductase subunit J
MFEITAIEGIFGFVLIASALGVLVAKQPVHACLSFLVTLLALAGLYFQLSAQFIAAMQILVYAGAILVLFMFVIVLFQDAHHHLEMTPAKSPRLFLDVVAFIFIITLLFLAKNFISLPNEKAEIPSSYGSIESLGQALYIDFFFPFEAVILMFLIALVGSLYIAKKVIE